MTINKKLYVVLSKIICHCVKIFLKSFITHIKQGLKNVLLYGRGSCTEWRRLVYCMAVREACICMAEVHFCMAEAQDGRGRGFAPSSDGWQFNKMRTFNVCKILNNSQYRDIFYLWELLPCKEDQGFWQCRAAGQYHQGVTSHSFSVQETPGSWTKIL